MQILFEEKRAEENEKSRQQRTVSKLKVKRIFMLSMFCTDNVWMASAKLIIEIYILRALLAFLTIPLMDTLCSIGLFGGRGDFLWGERWKSVGGQTNFTTEIEA